jgi:hypothetical protein
MKSFPIKYAYSILVVLMWIIPASFEIYVDQEKILQRISMQSAMSGPGMGAPEQMPMRPY